MNHQLQWFRILLLPVFGLATATCIAQSTSDSTPMSGASTSSSVLRPVWSSPGDWKSVAFDSSRSCLMGIDMKGTLSQIDPDGTVGSSVKLANPGSSLKLARLGAGQAQSPVWFTPWGSIVTANTGQGTLLWSHKDAAGVNDVWPGDLNGDGIDEVIVGYNAAEGIHALSSNGTMLWKYPHLANVWRVTTGDVDDDSRVEVITSSAQGGIHVLTNTGQKLRDIKPGFYASVMQTGVGQGLEKGFILAGGSAQGGDMLARYSGTGIEGWKIKICPAAHSLNSISVSPTGAMAAAGMKDGSVIIVETAGGTVIGTIPSAGKNAETVWTSEKSIITKDAMLIVARRAPLQAYQPKLLDDSRAMSKALRNL